MDGPYLGCEATFRYDDKTNSPRFFIDCVFDSDTASHQSKHVGKERYVKLDDLILKRAEDSICAKFGIIPGTTMVKVRDSKLPSSMFGCYALVMREDVPSFLNWSPEKECFRWVKLKVTTRDGTTVEVDADANSIEKLSDEDIKLGPQFGLAEQEETGSLSSTAPAAIVHAIPSAEVVHVVTAEAAPLSDEIAVATTVTTVPPPSAPSAPHEEEDDDDDASRIGESPAANILPVLLPLGLADNAGFLIKNGIDRISDLEEATLEDFVEYGLPREDATTLYEHFHPHNTIDSALFFPEWDCSACTCTNEGHVTICTVCGTPRGNVHDV
jgi:hypothetical protein